MSERAYLRNEAGFWIRAGSWHRTRRTHDQQGAATPWPGGSVSRGPWKSKGGKPGRRKTHTFVQFPHYMLRHEKLRRLSGRASKALLYLASQYNGHNNGDLQITAKLAGPFGWMSNANRQSAQRELIEAGFIVQTRQGGRNQCSLFALTWFEIDECDGKLDVPATSVASNEWQRGNSCIPLAGHVRPPVGQWTVAEGANDASLTRPWVSQADSEPSRIPLAGTFIDIPGGGASLRTFLRRSESCSEGSKTHAARFANQSWRRVMTHRETFRGPRRTGGGWVGPWPRGSSSTRKNLVRSVL